MSDELNPDLFDEDFEDAWDELDLDLEDLEDLYDELLEDEDEDECTCDEGCTCE